MLKKIRSLIQSPIICPHSAIQNAFRTLRLKIRMIALYAAVPSKLKLLRNFQKKEIEDGVLLHFDPF